MIILGLDKLSLEYLEYVSIKSISSLIDFTLTKLLAYGAENLENA